jgi:hypothetical protein
VYLQDNTKRAIKSGAFALILWIGTIIAQKTGWTEAAPKAVSFGAAMVLGIGAVLATVSAIWFTALARCERPPPLARYRGR